MDTIINRTTASTSPDFEFWMVRNPSLPPPNLISADEIFVDGVLLPLQLLHLRNQPPQNLPLPGDPPAASSADSTLPLSASKRWTSMFLKVTPAKARPDKREDREKSEKKKERKASAGATSAELNINIWPFSRSRSAGNSATRPKMFPNTRKVNSAPCSRSNSAGDSKSRKWPSSPGVHLGRGSPVWQVRRGAKHSYSESGVFTSKSSDEKESRRLKRKATAVGIGGRKSEVVNLEGPMCMGNRQNTSCGSDESGGGRRRSGNVGSSVITLFGLRSLLFNKKVD